MVKTDLHKGEKVWGVGGGGRWTEDKKTQDTAKSSVLQCSLICPLPQGSPRRLQEGREKCHLFELLNGKDALHPGVILLTNNLHFLHFMVNECLAASGNLKTGAPIASNNNKTSK